MLNRAGGQGGHSTAWRAALQIAPSANLAEYEERVLIFINAENIFQAALEKKRILFTSLIISIIIATILFKFKVFQSYLSTVTVVPPRIEYVSNLGELKNYYPVGPDVSVLILRKFSKIEGVRVFSRPSPDRQGILLGARSKSTERNANALRHMVKLIEKVTIEQWKPEKFELFQKYGLKSGAPFEFNKVSAMDEISHADDKTLSKLIFVYLIIMIPATLSYLIIVSIRLRRE